MGAGLVPSPTERQELELLGRLGLDDRASMEDVAHTRDELQAFLATAPRQLRGWARAQASAADEAFALLSEPTARRGPGALPEPHARSAAPSDGSATPPVRRATPAAEPAPAIASVPEGDDDAAFEAMVAELTPSMHRDRLAQPANTLAEPAAGTGMAQTSAGTRGRLPRILAVGVGLVAVVAVVFAVYKVGAPADASGAVGGASATPAASAGLDEARVAQLMGQIQQNPKDTAALLELGDAFFQAADYAAAGTWLEKLIALEPDNIRGLLALGAAEFNLRDATNAEIRWKAVIALEANNVEAHYDLGFLYLNATPPDLEGVQREWKQVVTLAPGTDIAKVVQQHLDALVAQSPAPSAGASGAPTSAPTAAPSGSVAP